MSLQQTVNYDVAANLEYNAALVETVSPVTKLKLTNISWPQVTTTYLTDTGSTYDASKIEFAAGVMRQKDLAPANSVVWSTFTSSLNAIFPALSAVLNGVPTNVGGKLVCSGTQGIYYTDASIGALAGVGAIKFIYRPNYTGAPATNINMVSLNAPAGNNDRINLTHSPTDTFRISINNNVGAAVVATVAIGGAAGLTSGVDYEMELNFDSVGGVVRLFKDGALHGTLFIGPWTHGTTANRLYIGATQNVYDTANATFDNPILFSTVQHTAGYTAGYTLPESRYGASVVDAPDAVIGVLPTDLQLVQWGANSNAVPNFILGGYWWDGAAWSVSNGTYAESNDNGTIIANIAAFPLIVGLNTLSIRIPFPDSPTQGIVTSTTPRAEANGYSQTDETVTTNSYTQMDCLESFAAVDTVVGSNITRYLIATYNVVGGSATYRWWDGAAWSVSNGTYAETNTAAEINTNALALDLSSGYYVRFFAFLHSANGTETPEVESITYDYCFFVFPGTLSKCFVYGWLTEVDCAFFADATVTVQNKKPFYHSGYLIPVSEQTFTVDASGYWEAEIIETESVQVPGADPAEPGYTFKINYTDPIAKTVTYNNIVVPNQGSAALEDLIP